MPERLIWLVPTLPVLAAAWIGIGYLAGWNRGERGERETTWAVLGGAGLALSSVLALDLAALVRGVPGQIEVAPWIESGAVRVPISFTLDRLGLGMGTLVALLSLLAVRFAIHYMHREAGFQRFFLALSLFNGAMLLIVTAGNAALTFVGWELAGVSSYLLIAYAFERANATVNATRAFVTNRLGDAGFVFAIFAALAWLGGVEWPQIDAGAARLDTLAAGVVAAGFLLAALAKSAQIPFAPWIGRALEGPTPSSALFYGALMVHAGVYLVIRLEPLFRQVPALMLLLVLVGLLTALYGWLGGLVQADVKSGLMFSTTAHVGLMFLACGLGWFGLATWYLAAHALWRAYQFFHAPAVMHAISRRARPVPRWMQGWPGLYTAALQRFWLDHMADGLLVRPTQALARDVANFDEQVVNRLVGLPAQTGAITTLAQWEAHRRGYVEGETGEIGRGYGIFGKLMEWVANTLHWFEEQLVLRGGGEGLLITLRHLGAGLLRIEQLLEQPRYLLVFVAMTFVVIL